MNIFVTTWRPVRNGLLTIFIFLPLLMSAQGKAPAKTPDYKKKGAPLPPFVIEKVNGTVFDRSVIKPNRPVLVLIVSPGCDHCEHMVDSIKKLTPQLAKMELVMVTEMRNKPNLTGFLKTKELDKNPVFKNAGYDKSNLIYYIYNSQLLPQINVYDSRQKLVKTFGGNFPMDSLKMYLH